MSLRKRLCDRWVMTSIEVVLGSIADQDVDAVVTTARGTEGAAIALPTSSGGYVFHTAGQNWHGGRSGEETVLTNCYRNCLILAEELGAWRIAFPPIATETYGFPPETAAELVAMAVRSRCPCDLRLVRLLVADELSGDLLNDALARPIVQQCLDCEAIAIPVLFGLPTKDSRAAGEAGRLHLAGCLSTGLGNDAQSQCTADEDHQWTDGEWGAVAGRHRTSGQRPMSTNSALPRFRRSHLTVATTVRR